MKLLFTLLTGAALAGTAPAADVTTPAMLAATPVPQTAHLLNDTERDAYRRAFAALRAHDWAGATTALDTVPSGPLTALAKAELYLADAPAADGAALVGLLTAAPDLPERWASSAWRAPRA